MAEELTRMLNELAERGKPRGSAEVLESARQDAGLVTAPPPQRSAWRRNALAFAGGTLALIIAIGAVVLLQGPGTTDDEAATTSAPPATTTILPTATTTMVPATTTMPPATTTVAPVVTTTSMAEPPPYVVLPISWERIDGPGAFDLRESLWPPGVLEGEGVGQSITIIIPVPSCSGCSDIAMYVAGGHVGIQPSQWDARIWVSIDGRAWTAVDSPTFGGEGGQSINAIATDGDLLVAVGTSTTGPWYSPTTEHPAVWVSDDLGATWQSTGGAGLDTDGRITDVAWTGAGFIAAGSEFWFSVDGLAWETSTELGPTELVRQIASADGGWFAAGDVDSGEPWRRAAGIWTSVDGTTWDLAFTADADTRGFDLTQTPGGLVAVGDVDVWQSADGMTWDHVNWEAPAAWWYPEMQDLVTTNGWLLATGNGASRWGDPRSFLWASSDGGNSWNVVKLPDEVFDVYLEAFDDLELMPFPIDAAGDRIVIAGHHRGNAAIWVGTFEE